MLCTIPLCGCRAGWPGAGSAEFLDLELPEPPFPRSTKEAHGPHRGRGDELLEVSGAPRGDALVEIIGRPELRTDARFAAPPARAKNAEALTSIIEVWARERDKRQVMAAMARRGIPCGAVLDTADVLDDVAHLQERGTVRNLEHPSSRPVQDDREPAAPVRLVDGAGRGPALRAAHRRGAPEAGRLVGGGGPAAPRRQGRELGDRRGLDGPLRTSPKDGMAPAKPALERGPPNARSPVTAISKFTPTRFLASPHLQRSTTSLAPSAGLAGTRPATYTTARA